MHYVLDEERVIFSDGIVGRGSEFAQAVELIKEELCALPDDVLREVAAVALVATFGFHELLWERDTLPATTDMWASRARDGLQEAISHTDALISAFTEPYLRFKRASNAHASAAQAEGARKAARAGAEGLHGKPGGSRDKAGKIREAWASGKYTSRDRCAEEEAAALGMSFSAARKALRNTPDPS
jgi:hypothetical protein